MFEFKAECWTKGPKAAQAMALRSNHYIKSLHMTIYMKTPMVNMAATEETIATPKGMVVPAKAALGGLGSSVEVGPDVGSDGIVGVMVGSAVVGASLGVMVGESVLTTGAAVGDAVGKSVGSAVSTHFFPLKHWPSPLQEQMAIAWEFLSEQSHASG